MFVLFFSTLSKWRLFTWIPVIFPPWCSYLPIKEVEWLIIYSFHLPWNFEYDIFVHASFISKDKNPNIFVSNFPISLYRAHWPKQGNELIGKWPWPSIGVVLNIFIVKTYFLSKYNKIKYIFIIFILFQSCYLTAYCNVFRKLKYESVSKEYKSHRDFKKLTVFTFPKH